MQDLENWVASYLPAGTSVEGALQLEPVTGDAGFREYFRTATSPSYIAVSAPPEHCDNEFFIRKQHAFRQAQVPVPHVYAVNFEQGFMLQEDLGDQLLLGQLTPETADEYYTAAESVLLRVQGMKADREVFGHYSEAELLREMRLFPEWFLERLLGMTLSATEQALLEKTFAHLTASAQWQPEVVVHRDFHARNLMLAGTANAEPGPDNLAAIDFQDAVIGPVTYDLVSLLRDCYIRWPTEYVCQRVLAYQSRLEDAGLLPATHPDVFLRWFDLMGLQRHIKVLGIFSRLWLRDQKPRYLGDLPLVLRYVMEQAGKHPELEDFFCWLNASVAPLLSLQDWYGAWEKAGEQDESNDFGSWLG